MADHCNNSPAEASTVKLLKRAIELEGQARYQPSLVCYQEGIDMLLEVIKGCRDPDRKKHYRDKVKEYMSRAESIKKLVGQLKEEGKYHEQTRIEDDEAGHDYAAVFGPYLDDAVTELRVEDAYIRTFHQINNFVRFCELLVRRCAKLEAVELITSRDEGNAKQQADGLRALSASLAQRSVLLTVTYSSSLHDREIRLSNGWIVKIGRGLDYFKKCDKFTIGSHDLALRRCHATTIDVFHSKFVKDR